MQDGGDIDTFLVSEMCGTAGNRAPLITRIFPGLVVGTAASAG